MAGMRDYDNPIVNRIPPPTSFPHPIGPTNAPISPAVPPAVSNADLLKELKSQSYGVKPLIRSAVVTGGVPRTLDWSAFGIMNRLVIRNMGPQSVWFSFDVDGGNVDNFTPSDTSWELQSNESVNLTNISFQRIGLRCAAGATTARVHAIGMANPAGRAEGTAL